MPGSNDPGLDAYNAMVMKDVMTPELVERLRKQQNPVPDRVIDAPIPAHLLRIGNDVHHPDVCDCDLVGLQDRCKIQPPLESVGDWIKRLIDIVARLEAEKQEARTEGWNAAIEEASGAAGQFWDEDDALQIDRIMAAIQCLSKPTAAKQGDPSSANRTEGRQG